MISTRNIKLNQNEKRANCQTKKLQAPTRRASARSESALLTDEGSTTHDPSRIHDHDIHAAHTLYDIRLNATCLCRNLIFIYII